jgi:nuclear pore complex protein Nup155
VSKLSTPYRSKIFDAGNATTVVAQTTTVNPLIGNDNDYLAVTDVNIEEPLKLASKFVDSSLLRDKITPVLDDSSFHGTAVNYNYSSDPDGLGPFSPFERTEIINLPDEILSQYGKVETSGKMGIFADISRAWVTIDNKLILWNLSKSSEFQSFEDIKHTILKVELVKPKPSTFTEAITHLLLIATPFDIHILAVAYSKNSIDLYNTGMTVPTHGLSVDQFIAYEKTGQIFFTGQGDGLHIWELQYSNSEDWLNKKCTKRCVTRSAVSSLIPGASLINSIANNYFTAESSAESVIQLDVDSTRGILYTLSNQSVIRAYKIQASGSVDEALVVRPSHISTYARTSSAKASPLLSDKYLKIVNINVVTRYENDDLFLVALTVGGCRLYLNGSSSQYSVSALRLESVKFPPTKMTEDEITSEQRTFKEQEALKEPSLFGARKPRELPTILSYQKKSSVLHQTKASSKIISPGIFFDVVEKENTKEQKLFVSVPDYGILKYHNKYVENATFLECSGTVHQIVPLTPTFNATERPRGYANEFATQYTKGVFEVAVLTNTSLQIYKFRTPDLVFETLSEDLTAFVSKYGLLESASTALYVTCKFNLPKTIRSNAFTFFTLGIPNIVDFTPKYRLSSSSMVISVLSNKNEMFSFSNVILSPRFYGIVTLIGRLFRDIWDDGVFTIGKDIKYNKDGSPLKSSVFENEYLHSVNIDQGNLEFLLSSISVLNEFFQTYGNSIACFIPPSFNNRNFDKAEEFANQAENIAINSAIRLVTSIKEALSFLAVLIKEGSDDTDGERIRDIFKYLSLDVQIALSKLKFRDIFAPSDESKNLIKEILSSIINRSMSRGESIEYIAKGLQERCGTFCSANDVVGFRAIEHLRKAKEIGFKDYDGLNYHLSRAIELFEAINNEISLEKLKESIDIMVGLNDYPRAIKFALNISSGIDQGNLAQQYAADGMLPNDERKKYYEKRKDIFEIVFDLLVRADRLALESNVKNIDDSSRFDTLLNPVTDFVKLRDLSYETALKVEDKLFHYELYDWFIAHDVSERLLEVDTPYVLGYLEEKASVSLEVSDLLWIYQSKKGHHYQAAVISYTLALSDFGISLAQRNEYLSRAIGFCNCTTLPNERQQVIQLSTMIEEVFEASNIQYDLLVTISQDKSLSEIKQDELIAQLNGKILTVSELFNDFANVLSYHEICLNIYKVSDFRNSEEIISRWYMLFETVKKTIYSNELLLANQSVIMSGNNAEKFITLLGATIVRVGKKLSNSEFVFPVDELLPIVINLIYEVEEAEQLVSQGDIVRIFLDCGIAYDKLYYILKDLIDTNGADVHREHYKSELVYLIKKWYDEDIRLREIISNDEVRKLGAYSTVNDPIHNYMVKTGNTI